MRKKELRQACKNLGLTWAPEQRREVASPDHRCYLWDQQDLVDLSHQENYCLTERSGICPWRQMRPTGRFWSTVLQRPALAAGIAASTALVVLSVLLLNTAANRGEAALETAQSLPDAAREAAEPAVLPVEPGVPLAPATAEGRLLSGASVAAPAAGRNLPGLAAPDDKEARARFVSALADGTSEAVLTFPEPGRRTLYLKIPAGWEITSAQLDLTGEAYVAEQVDQRNEATRYESTWGVRAQEFRPAGSVLTSVDLFLARTSSKPANLTVEIREDDGRGYPAARVLTSVNKGVEVGGYRWEKFDIPDREVEPGRSYWIVSYAKRPDEVAYPSTPSVGDYGYYLGMSLEDQYAAGESADFLTFPTGSRWEKYASRKGWDLMFRVNSLRQYFPTGPRLELGSDRGIQWSHPAELEGTEATEDFSSALTEYLLARRNPAGEDILVPLTLESDSPGVIRLSNIRIAGKIFR